MTDTHTHTHCAGVYSQSNWDLETQEKYTHRDS